MFNGQTVGFSPLDEQKIVTGLEIVAVDGHIEYRPKTETIPLGVRLGLQSVVSEDRRSVRVHLNAKLTNLDDSEVPVFPITTPAPDEEKGPDGKPRTVTHYIQQPRVLTMDVNRTLVIPDGNTAVLTGLVRQEVGRNEYGPPILSDLPYVGRLFRNVGYHCELHHLLVLVTPRILVNPEQENKSIKKISKIVTDATHEEAEVKGGSVKSAPLPIIPPSRSDETSPGAEPPDEAAILRAMPPVENDYPGFVTIHRDNMQIVTECLVDRIDPPRFYPLVGPARLRHCHWKCTVYYTEIVEGVDPSIAVRSTTPRVDVIYVDTDRLHLCGEEEGAK